MRVGIYGGTFSPVHNGHVAAARAFMEQMWLDILYVIPTGVTPHKVMKGEPFRFVNLMVLPAYG